MIDWWINGMGWDGWIDGDGMAINWSDVGSGDPSSGETWSTTSTRACNCQFYNFRSSYVCCDQLKLCWDMTVWLLWGLGWELNLIVELNPTFWFDLIWYDFRGCCAIRTNHNRTSIGAGNSFVGVVQLINSNECHQMSCFYYNLFLLYCFDAQHRNLHMFRENYQQWIMMLQVLNNKSLHFQMNWRWLSDKMGHGEMVIWIESPSIISIILCYFWLIWFGLDWIQKAIPSWCKSVHHSTIQSAS